MADPLGIAAGVLAVVTAAIQSTECLINTINGIKDAPEILSNINDDLNALHMILKKLYGATQNPQSKIVGSAGVELALETCSRACDNFARLLKKWTEETAGDKMNLWTRIKVRFGEDRIARFREQLRDTKLTLIVSLETATVLTTVELDSMKPMKDMILNRHEVTLVKEKSENVSKIDSVEQCLRRMPEASQNTDNESQELVAELRNQQNAKKLLAKMYDDAYSATYFARTGIRVHGVKATKGGLAMGGYINPPAELKMNHDMDVSDISAHGLDSVAMGGYVNVDFEKLRSKNVGGNPSERDDVKEKEQDEKKKRKFRPLFNTRK